MNPVAQPRTCPLLPPLPSCHRSQQAEDAHPFTCFRVCCHSGLLLVLPTPVFPSSSTMCFLLLNPLRTWHVLPMMLPWLPTTHQNLPNPRVPFRALCGLTPLIFLMTVMQMLWQVSYPFPGASPPPNLDTHNVHLPPLALCSKIQSISSMVHSSR